MDIRTLQKDIHKNAISKGWWNTTRPIPETLCLIHSEVSEALEAFRNHDQENFAEELADVAIRLLDAAEGYEIDLEAEIIKKHEFNKTRSYKHGGKAV
jgi:NTP pyrophosphatase (non-canonical NTP hydrolase)